MPWRYFNVPCHLGKCKTLDPDKPPDVSLPPGTSRQLQRCPFNDNEILQPVISCFTENCPSISCANCCEVSSCVACGLPVCRACQLRTHLYVCTGNPSEIPSKWDTSIYGHFPWCTLCSAPHAVAARCCDFCEQYQCSREYDCLSSIHICHRHTDKYVCHRSGCGRWCVSQRRIRSGRRCGPYTTPMTNSILGARDDMEQRMVFSCPDCWELRDDEA